MLGKPQVTPGGGGGQGSWPAWLCTGETGNSPRLPAGLRSAVSEAERARKRWVRQEPSELGSSSSVSGTAGSSGRESTAVVPQPPSEGTSCQRKGFVSSKLVQAASSKPPPLQDRRLRGVAVRYSPSPLAFRAAEALETAGHFSGCAKHTHWKELEGGSLRSRNAIAGSPLEAASCQVGSGLSQLCTAHTSWQVQSSAEALSSPGEKAGLAAGAICPHSHELHHQPMDPQCSPPRAESGRGPTWVFSDGQRPFRV